MCAREVYEIRIKGYIGGSWSDWLAGLRINHRGLDETIISGPTLDQSALQALLGRILDYNLKLISVNVAAVVEPTNVSTEHARKGTDTDG